MEMTEEQATSQVLFGLVIACYNDIDSDSVDHVSEGGHLQPVKQDAVFKQAVNPPRPTPQQYRLIEKVFQEEQVRRSEEMSSEGTDPHGELGVPGFSRLPRRYKALYVLCVLCLITFAVWYGRRRIFGNPRVFGELAPRMRTD